MTRVVTGDLGWCVARLTIDEAGHADTLQIISPAHTSESRHAPCESVCLYDRHRILKLKEFLNLHICAPDGATKETPCP